MRENGERIKARKEADEATQALAKAYVIYLGIIRELVKCAYCNSFDGYTTHT